jgi:SPX domain protein involved in polyphosphate accumulation
VSPNEARPDLRYEIKSVLPATELRTVHAWLRLHPAGFRVAYPPRHVNSIYFDTPERIGFRENLSGAARRRKLRLRWYGADVDEVRAVLEMKCKEGLLGWKESERLAEPFPLAGRTWSEVLRDLRGRLSDRFRVLLGLAGEPVLLVRYERAYLVSADGRVRATVDDSVTTVDQARRGGPRFSPPNEATPEIVLEVKAPEDRREDLERVLAEWPLRISRNSKFARGIAAAIG